MINLGGTFTGFPLTPGSLRVSLLHEDARDLFTSFSAYIPSGVSRKHMEYVFEIILAPVDLQINEFSGCFLHPH
jgi:hypothetical protein